MNAMSRVALRWAVVPLLGVLAGCTDASTALQDESRCPGETCAGDTQARLDAIAALDGVEEVQRVERLYGADRGSGRFADVRTNRDSHREQVDLGLAVMGELEDWPDHAAGVAKVTVAGPTTEVVLRLDGDWVCEEVDGVVEPCAPDNSWLISGEPVEEG